MRRFLIALLSLAPWLAQAQLESTSDLQRGLVGWWRFNEGTGTNAFDLSGNANTGTLSGSTLPVWTNGVFGGALSFDGSSSYVTTGTATMPGNTFTISFWFKASSVVTGRWLVEMGDNTVADHGISFSGNNLLFTSYYNAVSDNHHTNDAVVSSGRWYHVVWVRNAVTLLHSIYLNGVSDMTPQTVSAATAFYGTTKSYNIGGRGSASLYNGFIDDVRIYSRALSATEVLNLYCQGAGRTP